MDRPLPYGWITQVDPNSGHTFWVDTKATPPRSIWVHPLDDEQYLREHPEAREKHSHAADQMSPQYSAPPTPAPTPGSSSGHASTGGPSGPKKKQGFLGKLKDKMMELRERRHQEMLAQQAEMYQRQQQQQQQMYAQQQMYPQQPQYGYAPPQQQRSGFGGGGMAMPLLGGLAGGLLLGEALDGFGGDDGGGFGGDDGGDW
ncbi:hypothetical protein MSAN_02172500 [Mycena sanguinolenta]|uniref:WW domain-containing protein n=1 Tax=Mycena sanguinolenta TaxID=230812 RepID=A0A8H7CJA6_9AGAR|nr:hypothetical protein MSAN_02172500 [Mycena sanguinolenta]